MFKFFLGGISIALLIITISNIFLSEIGEFDIEEVIKMQKSPTLFLSAYNQDSFNYKSLMYQKIKPDIVVLGSSRVLGIRGEFFSRNSYNFGHAIQSIADLENAEKVLYQYSSLVIVGLDPWWFLGTTSRKTQGPDPLIISFDIIIRSILIGIKNILNLNKFNTTNYGLQAIINNEGFAIDGSYHYTKLLNNSNSVRDPGFSLTKEFVKNKSSVFHEKEIDPNKISYGCFVINKIRNKTDKIIIYAPPFPQYILNSLNDDGILDLYENIHKSLASCLGDIVIYNTHYTSIKDKDLDCEFIDGLHPGDVFSARLMRKFSEELKTDLFNIKYINKFIEDYSGKAGGMTLKDRRLESEVDLLKLGCIK